MQSHRFLRTVLREDALFCLVLGLAAALAPAAVGGFLMPQVTQVAGFAASVVMFEVGLLLVGYAGIVWFNSTRPELSRRWVQGFVVADALWILGTLALLGLAAPVFSNAGITTLLVVAAITGVLGVLKHRGLGEDASPVAA
jgi:hypothetical protein